MYHMVSIGIDKWYNMVYYIGMNQTEAQMTDNILHSTWYLNGEYGVSMYIGSALTPTDYEVERHTYERYRDQYRDFEDYWDGNANSLIIFYDRDAQIAHYNAMAELHERNAQAVDAGYGSL